jgi:uncharacterized membrane protein
MVNSSQVGRIFYGIAMAGMGFQTIYLADFPYMLIPPAHSGIPGLAIISYISGAMLILAGACIVFEKKPKTVALLLGTLLLLICFLYYVPYEFLATSAYMHFGEWENAAKVLGLSSGGFVVAGLYSTNNESFSPRFLSKLIPLGSLLFSLTILSFGINHFLYAKEASDYVPSWIPHPIFWIYFAGVALIGSSVAIILKIRIPLFAFLLGAMIFIWFIILHIPKVIGAADADRAGELTSAFLALAYSGIAFVIAGRRTLESNYTGGR